MLILSVPATGNYTEEIPPPTAKPPKLPDLRPKDHNDYIIHEFDAKKDKMPKIHLGMCFAAISVHTVFVLAMK